MMALSALSHCDSCSAGWQTCLGPLCARLVRGPTSCSATPSHCRHDHTWSHDCEHRRSILGYNVMSWCVILCIMYSYLHSQWDTTQWRSYAFCTCTYILLAPPCYVIQHNYGILCIYVCFKLLCLAVQLGYLVISYRLSKHSLLYQILIAG